ncbi:hypothetical protein AGRA3207_003049 [Actinomadura graeca]|uniref:TPM domain-containing protein n=1 Tax=Actinomadura graeca TaxID=2750812 RepID=A0ABX8QWI8_9ACTN|nr:hypothetical protein [Actinomadura graeca]QXJ22102.1 hypothetical protein AGRA3207_003049 [Actinomadura graeca]
MSSGTQARTPRRRAVATIVVGVLLALGLATPAHAAEPARAARPAAAAQGAAAQGAAAQAAASVRADDNVGQIAKGLMGSRLYVTSGAGNPLTPADQDQVKAALGRDGDADVRAVVVRNDVTRAEVGAMLKGVADRVGKGETYVAITADGKRMGGISKKLGNKEINQLVTRTNGAPLKDRLIQFGDLAEKKVDDKARSSTIGGFVTLGVLILLVAGAAGAFLVVRKRRRAQQAQQMAELKDGVQEDVTLLGEDIARLDLNVMDRNLDADTRSDYERAMNSYDGAKTATERATTPNDMQEVTRALEDGRYYMTATRARLAGEPVPERRAPCFFNPQHGPSVQDVTWAPPGGVARSVPACAADAEAVLRGGDPDVRMVPYGGGRRPYWDAGPAYAPYAGGYYYGYGGVDLLSGMMIGTMLGSMWGGGFGGGFGDGGGFGGDGDIGGGWDFGGGDFGGGGGGGDFGGF